MAIANSKRICLVPNVSGVGGMVSFRSKMTTGLALRGIHVTSNLSDPPYDAVLVVGGTRDLAGLWRARRRGVRIVQRLDGMNWIHRKKRTGWRHYMRAEYGNFVLSLIRSRLADAVVYQSEFSHLWWDRVYGKTRNQWSVVLNGVDLDRYSPKGPGNLPVDHIRVLLVEGSLGGGYEMGLAIAVDLSNRLVSTYHRKVELMVVGRTSPALRQQWENSATIPLTFAGEVPAESVPEIDRSAHILYAADLHPACPNSVIEALACGLPVAAFDTGALREIVTAGSGEVVPYGADPWKLEPPDVEKLARVVNTILDNLDQFRAAARQRAEAAFGLDRMVAGYLDAMNLS